ncbi:MAG TPA: hypothetical protein PKD91_01920, partial [Bacteroidia bacterium]|nr:hypothetical protein [Bacteroidia bacterium]
HFQRVPETNTHYRSAYASVDEVLQAFAVPFVSKSTTTFKPWEQKLGEFKIDKLVTPDRVRQSWLGFLADIPEKDRSKWPIIEWLIRKMLIPRAKADFTNKVAYWGWQLTGFDASSPVVNGTTYQRDFASENALLPANASMDGIRTQIAKMNTAGRVNVITVGSWDADDADFCTQIEEFAKEIPTQYRSEIDFLFMSEDFRNKYRDGRRAKYNMNYAQEQDLDLIKDTNIRVKSTVSMATSTQVWCTLKTNRKMPVKADMPGTFDVQKLDRTVKLLSDWSYLLTFDVPEFIWSSDHELTISAGDITDHYS